MCVVVYLNEEILMAQQEDEDQYKQNQDADNLFHKNEEYKKIFMSQMSRTKTENQDLSSLNQESLILDIDSEHLIENVKKFSFHGVNESVNESVDDESSDEDDGFEYEYEYEYKCVWRNGAKVHNNIPQYPLNNNAIECLDEEDEMHFQNFDVGYFRNKDKSIESKFEKQVDDPKIDDDCDNDQECFYNNNQNLNVFFKQNKPNNQNNRLMEVGNAMIDLLSMLKGESKQDKAKKMVEESCAQKYPALYSKNSICFLATLDTKKYNELLTDVRNIAQRVVTDITKDQSSDQQGLVLLDFSPLS